MMKFVDKMIIMSVWQLEISANQFCCSHECSTRDREPHPNKMPLPSPPLSKQVRYLKVIYNQSKLKTIYLIYIYIVICRRTKRRSKLIVEADLFSSNVFLLRKLVERVCLVDGFSILVFPNPFHVRIACERLGHPDLFSSNLIFPHGSSAVGKF